MSAGISAADIAPVKGTEERQSAPSASDGNRSIMFGGRCATVDYETACSRHPGCTSGLLLATGRGTVQTRNAVCLGIGTDLHALRP